MAWARSSRLPLRTGFLEDDTTNLAPIEKIVGSARVVALSEAVHGAAQPLAFRNRLFRHLVERMGFTAIAIESGIVEGRWIDDFVIGKGGERQEVLTQGLSWTFDQLPQNGMLVDWLRAYNMERDGARSINFYGFDMPGSPGNAQAARGPETALIETLSYLSGVDPQAAAGLQERLGSLLSAMKFDFYGPSDRRGYDTLTMAERDTVTAVVADMLCLLERREADYTQLSSADDYEWALRYAVSALQVDQWLRQMPLGWHPGCKSILSGDEQQRFLSVATDIRDRAQADNLEWIVRREGPHGKVLTYGHRYHLSKSPIKASWTGYRKQRPMGSYLAQRLGESMVVIGNTVGSGSCACAGHAQHLAPPPPGSIDHLAREVGPGSFMLDMREAPPEAISWLEQGRLLGHGPSGATQDILELPPGRAFDVLFHIDKVTAADGSL